MTNPRHKTNPSLALFKARDVEQVRRWIEAGADVNVRNEKGNTPLLNAARKGWIDAVKVLLDAGARVDVISKKGMGIGFAVARSGNVECLDLLLSAGLDILVRDEWGRTALMVATHPQMVEKLVSAGLSVHDTDHEGRGALHRLVSEQNALLPASVDTLLSLGANIDLRDSQGNTPLMSTAHPWMIAGLLDRGASVSAVNKCGENVLHRLFRSRYIVQEDTITRLLDKGADPAHKDEAGVSPIELVREKAEKYYQGHEAHDLYAATVVLMERASLASQTPTAQPPARPLPRL